MLWLSAKGGEDCLHYNRKALDVLDASCTFVVRFAVIVGSLLSAEPADPGQRAGGPTRVRTCSSSGPLAVLSPSLLFVIILEQAIEDDAHDADDQRA